MVDDNQEVVKAVNEYFSSHAVIDVIGSANDGEDAKSINIKSRFL